MVHVDRSISSRWQEWDEFSTSVEKYQWVLALPWFIILLVYLLMQPRENQPGVDQVPGQFGSELQPVIFRDIYVISLVCTRQISVNKNSVGWSFS